MSPSDGRVVLVSGGSRGIGAATVRRLAEDGWDVSFCHDRDEQAALSMEKAVSELGVRVLAVQVDLTAGAAVKSWAQRAEEELGPVQAAVSCAGISRDLPLALAGQTARYGIRVNAVVPGVVESDLTAIWPEEGPKNGPKNGPKKGPERARARLTEAIVLRRFGSAAEVADRVAFLLSDQAGDLTGRVLEVDGGISL